MDIDRSSMIILHPTALPGGHGIGDFGKNAYEWSDFLEKTGVKIWQVLPFGPTDNVQFSPYSSSSSKLGNFALIDLTYLAEIGIIKKEDLNNSPKNLSKINFLDVYKYKESILRKSHTNLYKDNKNTLHNEINEYEEVNPGLENELIFQMATSLYGDDWKIWPEDLINPNKNTLKNFKEENKKEYSYQLFVQFLFTKQLNKLNEYGSKKMSKYWVTFLSIQTFILVMFG